MVDFKAPYSRTNALEFLDKFMPDDFQKFDEEIKLDFKPQFIRSIRKIGEVISLENTHVYEITHESENDPRVSLSKDSFRLLANFNVRKALIFFVSQNSPNYRLSLVTVDLEWESGAKVKREYSNPRRYSFFLGLDARVHTPYDFLIKKGQVKNTTDLLSRFDVEIVTKEFFTKYKGLFNDVSGYLEKDHGFKIFAGRNNIDIDTFAKKLLGQIVFCYFLQRKGWLGAEKGEPINKGDKDFMRSLFSRCAEEKNFYNDYLEYLFYGSLNSRAEGSGDFYRKHFDCQIPFLNGGLFEPPEDYDWEKSFVHIPDKLFSNKENTGILDVFDLYNFTVYEDDPIDREVSVDPEMLGKVFENLLPENLRKGQGAYYTPREIVHYMCQESLVNYLVTETKVDIDKIRDLVVTKHFEGGGSRESIDRALQNIKVCDPACGSGAFLVGMLHEIVSARRILTLQKDEYHLKKETIQDCIYGVDIDPGAVDIAKLRLWLSLVVDYELKDIEPLPNLDYKIMCGNSLLEELIIGEESIKLFDERLLNIAKGSKAKNSLFNDEEFKSKSASAKIEYLQNQLKVKQRQMLELHSQNQLTSEKRKELDQEIEALNKELNPKSRKRVIDYHPTLFGDKAEKYFNLLKELHKQYFTEYDPKRKKEKRKQIEGIEVEFIKSSINEKVDDIENRIRNLNMQDSGDRKQQAVLMKKKLECLAIPEQIHNSHAKPYFLWKINFFEVFQEKGGFDVVIANPPYIEFKNLEKEIKNTLVNYETTRGKFDLYIPFLERNKYLLQEEGVAVYICPTRFMKRDYGKAMREFFAGSYKFIKIIDFSDIQIFASVTNYTGIFIFTPNQTPKEFRFVKFSNTKHLSIAEFGNSLSSENSSPYTEIINIPNSDLNSEAWCFHNSKNTDLINRIQEGSVSLSSICEGIFQGIATGKDEVFIIDEEFISKYKIEKEIVYPILKGKDIKKYHINWSRKYVLYPYDNKGVVIPEEQLAQRFKHAYKYLEDMRNNLKGRDYFDNSNKRWYELWNQRNLNRFFQSKIITLDNSRMNSFAFDEGKFLGTTTTYSIILQDKAIENYLFVLSLLNSSLLEYFHKQMTIPQAGGFYRYQAIFINDLPIKEVKASVRGQIIEIVRKVIDVTRDENYVKNANKQVKVKEYERQIDQMVYKFYGLTLEEIKIVENFCKES